MLASIAILPKCLVIYLIKRWYCMSGTHNLDTNKYMYLTISCKFQNEYTAPVSTGNLYYYYYPVAAYPLDEKVGQEAEDDELDPLQRSHRLDNRKPPAR